MQQNLSFHLFYILRFQVIPPGEAWGSFPSLPCLTTQLGLCSLKKVFHTQAGLDVHTNPGSPLPLGQGSPHTICVPTLSFYFPPS